MKMKMKTIEEIQEIFKVFNESKEHFIEYLQSTDWNITIIKSYEEEGIISYPFRIYGKISGSYFGGDYRWYGGVTYTYNIKENSLTRTENENELHPIIVKHVDLQEIQMKI
jgi:hypothetical protein